MLQIGGKSGGRAMRREDYSDKDKWILEKFEFVKAHIIRRKANRETMGDVGGDSDEEDEGDDGQDEEGLMSEGFTPGGASPSASPTPSATSRLSVSPTPSASTEVSPGIRCKY